MTGVISSADVRPLKLAVCGSGRWGQVIMRNIASSPDLVLAAVVSSRPSLPDSLSFGAPVFADWRAAHSRVGLDGIVLALPPDCQAEIASDIIEAGLPLFMEKPLALSNDAVQRLIQAADTFGFVGLVDHLHLFSPEFRELVRQVRDRGDVCAITAISGNRGPGRDSWSVLWDWAPHDVAMVLTVMETVPVSVSAAIVERAADGAQALENVSLKLEFADGTVANITTGNAFDRRCREFVVCIGDTTLTYAESADNERSLLILQGDDAQPACVDSIAPLTAALAEFAIRIRRGVGGDSDLALGAEVVRVLSAAEESMKRGAAVSLKPGL